MAKGSSNSSESFGSSPFLDPLSQEQFDEEARAALRLAFSPQRRVIFDEIAASKLAAERAKDYFRTYGQSLTKADKGTTQAYRAAKGDITASSQDAADYAETLRQRLSAEARADAETRGVAYDPTGSEVGVEANLARINAANVLRGVTAASGAAQKSHFQDKKRIGVREGIEQQFREQARQRSLQDELKTMTGDMAAQIASMYAAARDSDRDFYLGLKASEEPAKDRQFDASQASKDRRFDAKQSDKSHQNQMDLARRQGRNQRADDRRSRKYAKRFGQGGGSSGKGKGKKHSNPWVKQMQKRANPF